MNDQEKDKFHSMTEAYEETIKLGYLAKVHIFSAMLALYMEEVITRLERLGNPKVEEEIKRAAVHLVEEQDTAKIFVRLCEIGTKLQWLKKNYNGQYSERLTLLNNFVDLLKNIV